MAQSPPDPQKQAEALAAVVAAQAVAYQKLEDKLAETVKKLMGLLFQRWYYQDEVDDVVDQLVEAVRTTQEAIADMTEEYLDRVFDVMGVVKKPSQRNAHVKLPKRLRDVDPKTEWNRPARDARVSRLLGADEFEANEKALLRAERQARMDAALAMREAEKQRWGVSDEIIGYRRILHPELSKYGVCGLCVVAASRTYQKEKLKPLHNLCRCTVLPVLKRGDLTIDPGQDMNRKDLDAFYEAAGGTGRQGLQRVVVKELAHGELGPILVDNKYKNRTAKSKPLEQRTDMSPETLFKVQDAVIRKYEASVKAGVTPQFDVEYHRRLRKKYADMLGISIMDEAA